STNPRPDRRMIYGLDSRARHARARTRSLTPPHLNSTEPLADALYRASTSVGLEGLAAAGRVGVGRRGAFMKFNPPPNWPQPVAGWSPPPGWKPDPSWPKPPPGWQLWIEEDEFVISPFRATASWPQPRAQQPRNWYQRTVSVVLLLIFFFPVGIVLLWMRRDWSVGRRGLVTAVVGIVVLLVAVSPSSPQTTTTALSPTAVGGSSPSAYASASSQSATPSPSPSSSSSAAAVVVAPTKARPATSAPPMTTAAAPAPVHTSAAPVTVHTTKATQPAPVKTTTQKQSCTPLTNSGKCYTPGEFCRSTDHGKSGIDADGDPITCVDNDGWRWERT
ncbi:hypothetical protein KDL01_21265, partial [Actinospica durhamensis]